MCFVEITVCDRFQCSLPRAFAAPILGDATEYLDGYRLQPGIVGFEDDSTWGQPSGVRYPVTRGNWCVPAGRLLTDIVLQRVENEWWEWKICEFRASSLFFVKHAIGTWKTREVSPGEVDVRFSYRYFVSRWIYLPVLHAFAAIQVRGMLEQALARIKAYAESDRPMLYS